MRLWDWIVWHFWQKWVYQFKHRNDTLEESLTELEERWNKVLHEFKDAPDDKVLHDSINSMERVKRLFHGKENENGKNDRVK
jgi:hypothetical protein